MKKLLIVVDMQNDFVYGPLGTPEARNIVQPMKQFIESFDGEVLFTRDTHHPDYLNTQEGKKLPVVHCIEGESGWEIVSELNELAIWVLDKGTFGSVDLVAILMDGFYDEIHFCGVCTGICVISNVVIAKASIPEIPIYVHENLCACVTPESHIRALESIKTLQVDVI